MSKKNHKNYKKENSKKEYWTIETEEAVKEYLKNDFNFYQHKIDKHLDDVDKSIEKNKKNPKCKILKVDEDFILKNKLMVEKTNNLKTIRVRDEIFRKQIYKPLTRLVENIIFNFKLFISGEDVKTTHNDCMAHVIEKFCNFDPENGAKSFSFYGTVSKHHLQNRRKDKYKSTKRDLNFEDHSSEAEEVSNFEIDDESDLDSSMALFRFVIEVFEKEIDRDGISNNDARVAEAIVDIFKSHELIGAYQKSSVYNLIKEHTGLETKDITYSLHRFKILYRLKKQNFVEEHKDKYYGSDEDDVFYYK